MNTRTSTHFGVVCSARPVPPRRDAGFGHVVRLLLEWQRRDRERRALASLDDRLLQDIGLDRQLARREAAKPFWKA